MQASGHKQDTAATVARAECQALACVRAGARVLARAEVPGTHQGTHAT